MAASNASRPRPASGTFERYRIESELGRGGMGAVYRAIETGSQRVVALKTLAGHDSKLVALFEREYHTLASLKHPRVIEVYDFGITADGQRYYTMELLDGDELMAMAPLPWRKACAHLRDVATSLALLHARGLVHRDVSPRNVRLDGNGRAKLLDFGALTPFGVASEIVGTPMCIAPEAVRSLELDQRSDLFSLGVVAYHALTNRKPFEIHQLRDAEHAYQPPPAPSALVAEIPRALDELVLSLISVDPLGRPASAAEVIERLSAIAELDDAPLAALAEGHLLSTALAGREREKSQLEQYVKRAVRGQGGVLVVEGAAGIGKSRILAELIIDARLSGMTTLRVEALAHSEPDSLLRGLLLSLLATAPVEARAVLAAHAPVLAAAFPELRAELGGADAPEPTQPRDASERRARIQHAWVQCLIDFASRRPLLVAVDDLHASDASSAGALIGLAHAVPRARLLLAVTRTLEGPLPHALEHLARLAGRIRLRALDAAALERLVASAVGEVPHRARLVDWLRSAAQGNPAQTLDLLRDLCDRGLIRYAGGTWVLPAKLSERDLPMDLAGALRTRLSQLDGRALDLARLLALHQGGLTLALCHRLLTGSDGSAVFAALDELLVRGIVVGSGESYRLRQQALRSLLVEGLSVERIAALHLALAHALIDSCAVLQQDTRRTDASRGPLGNASAADIGSALQAGWHLVHGGQQERGRDLLRDAAIELTHRGEGLVDAVPALEAALASYREQGRSRFECAYLMVPLTLAGTYADFRLSYRYGDELLEILVDAAGFDIASGLERFVGGRPALWISLVLGALRAFRGERSRAARSFRELILGVISLGTAVMGVCSPLLDRARGERVLEQLRPLSWFPRRTPAHLVYEFNLAMLEALRGELTAARRRGRRVRAELSAQGGARDIPEDARAQLAAGVSILIGSMDVTRTDESLQESLEVFDKNPTSISRQTAAGLRAAHHACRGEHALFERYREEVDVLAAQSGSTWRQDVWIARTIWLTYALSEDVIGLKRTARQLEALSDEVPSLRETRDAANACYLAERGLHEEALERYAETFEAAVREPTPLASRFACVYARILRRAGRARQACDLLDRLFSALDPEDLEFRGNTHGALLEHALAIADLGDHARAASALDALIESQRAHDNPLIHGLTHKARAQVALLARDGAAFVAQLDAMHDWFRRSENPALIAQTRRLADEGRRAGLLDATRRYSQRPGAPSDRDAAAIQSALADCRGPAERLELALALIVEEARAEHGYLYLHEPEGLRFAAPTAGIEPPESLRRELLARIEEADDDDTRTEVAHPARASELRTLVQFDEPSPRDRLLEGQPYRVLLLTCAGRGAPLVVGAVAMIQGEEALAPIDHAFLEQVARCVYDAGDVRSVYFASHAERRG